MLLVNPFYIVNIIIMFLLIVGTVRIKYLRNLFILGPHFNTTTVTIFIITSDNTVDFRFYNTIEEVQDQEDGVSV